MLIYIKILIYSLLPYNLGMALRHTHLNHSSFSYILVKNLVELDCLNRLWREIETKKKKKKSEKSWLTLILEY